jgi:hypothetical protein
VAQNVRYVETSFHLHVTEFIHVPGPEIIAAILRRRRPASRYASSPACCATPTTAPFARRSTSLETWDDLAGVDLHGLETMPTEPWSFKIWERVSGAGKVTKCHAGEFTGPSRVSEAIQQLGVKRVQHGVRSARIPRS